MYLVATTDSLEGFMGEAVTTTNPVCHVFWADNTTTTLTPGKTITSFNGVTDVTLVAAPGASTQRLIKEIHIVNVDTVSHTITVQVDVSGTETVLLKAQSLPASGCLQWTAETGWKIGTASGGGSGGSTTFIGLTDVPASFSGQTLKQVRVNSGETALEFFTPSGGSGTPADVQEFTGSGTWTKPAGSPQIVEVIMFAGGGGAGGGRGAAGGGDRGAGCGGGGGAFARRAFKAADLGATVAVTVGAGGSAGIGGSSADGSAGGAGGNTTFGTHLSAFGGGFTWGAVYVKWAYNS